MPARISIVIPVLNESACIERTLAALAPLRARGHELIVVDGGSTDRTPDLAAPHADRVLAAPKGRANQMNAGAGTATGDVLLFLHADTTLPDAADCLILAHLAESGRAWGRFDVRIAGTHPMLAVVAWLMNRRSRLTGIATGDQAMFVMREAFAAVGGFPPLALMEDIALSTSLTRVSPPACLAERAVTSGRRWESRGVFRTILLMWWLRFRYWLGAPPERLVGRYEGRE